MAVTHIMKIRMILSPPTTTSSSSNNSHVKSNYGKMLPEIIEICDPSPIVESLVRLAWGASERAWRVLCMFIPRGLGMNCRVMIGIIIMKDTMISSISSYNSHKGDTTGIHCNSKALISMKEEGG